jgi:hypothetical protein
MDGEQMKVQAPGRLPMQRVYLWVGNREGSKNKEIGSRFTNRPYKPDEDGPCVATQGGRLPTNEKLQPDPNAVQYLEVGLVIGDNPSVYKPTAASGKKDTKAARQLRGEMPRAESALRAFIPVTENVSLQSKYYVGTKLIAGRLNPRVIDGEVIFCYPEFWQGAPEGASKVQRRTFINNRRKYAAAASKAQAKRATASTTVDDMKYRTTSNPLSVTPPVNIHK